MFGPSLQSLIRKEVVVHLQDGETSIRGFLMDFYKDPTSVRIVKPVLLVPDGNPSEMGGEALIFGEQIKFIQLLGG